MQTEKPRHRRWTIIAIAALVMNTVLATAVIAGHTFNDVPSNHTFHDDIAWLAANDITRGCNPPANTSYCPQDDVNRGQMAAFMRRFAGAFGAADSTIELVHAEIPPGAFFEVLSLDVNPKHEARVVLNAMVGISKTGPEVGNYNVRIQRGSCDGPIVGAIGAWLTDEATARATVSATGLDTISGPATYKVCVGRSDAVSHVFNGNINALWVPAG